MMNPEKVLPPGVNGKISGHLIVKVDEVFWTKTSPGEVFVELLWWGEKDCSIFRPEDITLKDVKQIDSSVIYNIRTSQGLFESYLRNCGKLTFTVLRGQNKNVAIGSSVVKDLEHIISEQNYHSYFPIFSPKGVRLGDLHICFELKFKLKQCHFTVKRQDQSDVIQPKDIRKPLSSKSSTATSQEDQLLSNILQKGQELRKAMVMSVLADCPIDKIDSVVNSNAGSSSVKEVPRKQEAKLVDFLLGKDMAPDEETQALEMLRCVSPDENLLNIAKSSSMSPKVTKTSCCLHGRKCSKKKRPRLKTNTVPIVSDNPPLTAISDIQSSQPIPSSSDIRTYEELHEVRRKDDPEEARKDSFNCYKLIVKTLNLTPEGGRKIYYAPTLKDTEQSKYNQNPPGTSFLLEITVPSKGPWARRLKFSTKTYKGQCVKFGQGTTHKLCGTVTWARVKTHVLGSVFTVYWRHLNQRVPCPLGSAKLDSFNPPPDTDSLSLSLPVFSNTRLLTGHLNVCVKLAETSKSGGEAMFKLKDDADISSSETPPHPLNSNQEPDSLPSYESAKPDTVVVSSEPSFTPLSSASSDNGNEGDPGPSSLDEELIRTINLLNSKTENVPRMDSVQATKTQIHKQEACVQTTLPIDTDCQSCGCSTKNNKAFQREVHPEASETKFQPPLVHHDILEDPGKPPPLNSVRKEIPSKDKWPEPIHGGNYTAKDHYLQDVNMDEKLCTIPLENNGIEKIHEFTVKIDKVVGVPLFTGDFDLDCYVDYSFPKVETSGRMVFDRINMATDVKIALRETEFGAVSRYRLRLRCKLTRALLSLPTNEIIFYLWGRFYSPTPQDYRLGKAALPLAKLSALELKYEQHKERQPITEKFILPISVLKTSLTSGFEGPFGEMHVAISYSNASGLSYREWMCKNKDDHYWCRSRLVHHQQTDAPTLEYECARAQADVYGSNYSQTKKEVTTDTRCHINSVQPHCSLSCGNDRKELYNSESSIANRLINRNYIPEVTGQLRDCRIEPNNYQRDPRIEPNYYQRDPRIDDHTPKINGFIPADVKFVPPAFESNKIVQTNLKETVVENGFTTGLPRGYENYYMPKGGRGDSIDKNHFPTVNSRMQPIGSSNHIGSYSENNIPKPFFINEYGKTEQIINSGKRENIVEKVLRDIKERKDREKLLIENGSTSIQKTNNKQADGDVFDSFDLRVDLPTHEDNSDFEVNSRYSFLKTPPPVESTFPNKNCNDFETNSSLSIMQRVQQEQVINPFSSQSHLSLSLNSDSSMFRKSPVKLINSSHKPIFKNAKGRENEICFLENLESCSIPKETRKQFITNKRNKKKYSAIPGSENDISSDETLKSVESLKSYKELPSQRQSRDVGVGTEFDTVNKDTQTSQKEKDNFKARVEICRALGLPPLEVKKSDGNIVMVKPTSQAYFSAIVNGREEVLKTPVVKKKSNPVWDSSWEVFLPTDLLKKCDRELEIFVELNGDCEEAPIRTSDGSMHCPVVLRTGIDLTPMTAGLEHASGWFSLSDRALLSRAQIKVIVTPLEDISRFREDWLKEYTKSKSRKIDLCIPERSSSLATSLQEKLIELEKLTDRMKRKMANKTKWDDSPPLSLLTEVQRKSLATPLEDIIAKHINARPGNGKNTTETATSPILLPGEVKSISPVVISDDDDKGSCGVVDTYTICESSSGEGTEAESNGPDSLETPSQTIDRILTHVRKNR